MFKIGTRNLAIDAILGQLNVQDERIYDTTLKAILEPDNNGQVVAIHPETESYAIGRTPTYARHLLRAMRPEGLIWTRIIGPETRHSLIRRILGFLGRTASARHE